MYAEGGRESIAPEKLLRALMLQLLYGMRSERLVAEQLGYNLLFRWFVGVATSYAYVNSDQSTPLAATRVPAHLMLIELFWCDVPNGAVMAIIEMTWKVVRPSVPMTVTVIKEHDS